MSKNHRKQWFSMIFGDFCPNSWLLMTLCCPICFYPSEKAMMRSSFVVFSERRYDLNKKLSKNIKFRESYSPQHLMLKKSHFHGNLNSKKKHSYMNALTSSRWPMSDNCKKKGAKVGGHNFFLRQYFSMRFFAKNIYVVWKPRIWTLSWISRPGKFSNLAIWYCSKFEILVLRMTLFC